MIQRVRLKNLTSEKHTSTIHLMHTDSIVFGRRAVRLDNIHYHILPGKFGSMIDGPRFQKMFLFWKQQWEPLFRSISGVNELDIDDFLRQFEVTALFHEDEIVGLLCLDLFDLDNETHWDHSYFSWLAPENRIAFKNFGYSLVINQLAVSKLWRGEYGISDLLVGLAARRMQNSPFQRTICYTRNFRRTDSLAERWGARVVLKDQIVHNEPSTYYEFPKNCFAESNHSMTAIVEAVWEKSIKNKSIFLNQINFNQQTERIKNELEINS